MRGQAGYLYEQRAIHKVRRLINKVYFVTGALDPQSIDSCDAVDRVKLSARPR